MSIGLGIMASLLFFISILLHELAHSIVAKARGLPVRRITLFFFGGISNIEREPPSPGTELFMAAVGPLTSILLGVAFIWIGIQNIPQIATAFHDPMQWFPRILTNMPTQIPLQTLPLIGPKRRPISPIWLVMGSRAGSVAVSLSKACPEFPEKEKLGMEKEVLGYYLTSHPLSQHEATLRTYCSHTSTQLPTLEARSEVFVGGMLAAIKMSHTKNPRPGSVHTKYAMWDLEDLEGIVRCIMWPEQFAEFGELVKADAILAVRASIDRRPGAEEINLIVNELIPLEELSTRFSNGVVIRVREEAQGIDILTSLREIVRGYPGTKPLRLRLELAEGGSVTLDCAKSAVAIDPELRRRVEELLGPGSFRVTGRRAEARGAAIGAEQSAAADGSELSWLVCVWKYRPKHRIFRRASTTSASVAARIELDAFFATAHDRSPVIAPGPRSEQ